MDVSCCKRVKMVNLSARLFGTHYLVKVRRDANVLHYKRAPTWRSLVLFAGKEIKIMCVSGDSSYVY